MFRKGAERTKTYQTLEKAQENQKQTEAPAKRHARPTRPWLAWLRGCLACHARPGQAARNQARQPARQPPGQQPGQAKPGSVETVWPGNQPGITLVVTWRELLVKEKQRKEA